MNQPTPLPAPVDLGLANAASTLRFIQLALIGLSLETPDDDTARDVRSLATALTSVMEQIHGLRKVPEHCGELVH